MQPISQSEIAKWDRCRRAWFISYYLGFVLNDEPPTGNRLLGIRIHTALEGWYGYQLDPLMVLQFLYTIEIEAHPEFEGELRAEWEMARAMVEGYLEWVDAEGKDAGLAVVHTEAEVQVPLANGVILRARLDQVVRREIDGALLFLDHKTAASFTQHEFLALNPQFRIYSLIQQLAARGQPGAPVVAGGMINTLRRVKRTGRSQPPYYARDEFRFNDEIMASTWLRLVKITSEIAEARRALDWAYSEAGGRGDLAVVNSLQRHLLRPTPIVGDCDWRCELASGLCLAMDDGSDWPSILMNSGRYKQEDPYRRYDEDPIKTIREQLGQ
jgi:PD-(D/E)XK nuclease superfamily